MSELLTAYDYTGNDPEVLRTQNTNTSFGTALTDTNSLFYPGWRQYENSSTFYWYGLYPAVEKDKTNLNVAYQNANSGSSPTLVEGSLVGRLDVNYQNPTGLQEKLWGGLGSSVYELKQVGLLDYYDDGVFWQDTGTDVMWYYTVDDKEVKTTYRGPMFKYYGSNLDNDVEFFAGIPPFNTDPGLYDNSTGNDNLINKAWLRIYGQSKSSANESSLSTNRSVYDITPKCVILDESRVIFDGTTYKIPAGISSEEFCWVLEERWRYEYKYGRTWRVSV